MTIRLDMVSYNSIQYSRIECHRVKIDIFHSARHGVCLESTLKNLGPSMYTMHW